jgi:hypothetical protein
VCWAGVCASLLGVAVAQDGTAPGTEPKSRAGIASVVEAANPSTASARVDHWIERQLERDGLVPAAICDDATFLRRVTLDLTGRNPLAAEVVAFLDDPDPGKRVRTIDRLLESPACAAHLADVWSDWLLPERDTPEPRAARTGLHTWLRTRFRDNLRYDRLVADLLVASGSADSGPGVFFLSLEGKPEKLAAKTSRVFLGVQLDCAECHDHPFDHWKQKDFWSFAAYFAQLSADPMLAGGGRLEVRDRKEGEVTLPGTEDVVPPKPLVRTGLSGLDSGTRRQQLALWLTARENPYLARAAVNRVWSLLFGRGLIEPIDDMRSLELASHPELLEELAQDFSRSGFDLRRLLRTLAGTRAYQRASWIAEADPTHAGALGLHHPATSSPSNRELNGEVDHELNGESSDVYGEGSYAVMPVKPLTSRQLVNCLTQVARETLEPGTPLRFDPLVDQLGRLRGEGGAASLGIVQALVTLHGEQLAGVHDRQQSRLLKALTAPHLERREQVEWLFLSTLCRLPHAAEWELLAEEFGGVATRVPADSTVEADPSAAAAAVTDTAADANADTNADAGVDFATSGTGEAERASLDGQAAQAGGPRTVPEWQADLLWALINSTEFAMTP